MENKVKDSPKTETKFETIHIKNSLPVMKKAVEEGLNEREIGVLLGYLGNNPRKNLAKIEKECSNPAEAIKLALKMANSYLVLKLYQVAVGSRCREEVNDYITMPKTDSAGNSYTVCLENKRKVTNKVMQPEVGAVKLLVKNQLPNLFREIIAENRTERIEKDDSTNLNDLVGELTDGK